MESELIREHVVSIIKLLKRIHSVLVVFMCVVSIFMLTVLLLWP